MALPTLLLLAVSSACATSRDARTGTPAATVEAENLEQSLADSPPATEEAQVAMGARLFDRNCDACHGQRGEGNVGVLDGPQVIGREVLMHDLNYGQGYGNALQLHDFVAHHLPKLGRRHLAQHEYWAVTAYMLYESDQPLQQRVDDDSARYIIIGNDTLVASSELR
jgi:mono/diheme cytochrome c family protein